MISFAAAALGPPFHREDTPAFVTHSNGLLACKNVPELGGNVISNESCFKYFAREL